MQTNELFGIIGSAGHLKLSTQRKVWKKYKNGKEYLNMQVAGLRDFIYRNEDIIVIAYKPLLTLIDGKILNALTGTPSTQCCPI